MRREILIIKVLKLINSFDESFQPYTVRFCSYGSPSFNLKSVNVVVLVALVL